MNFMHSAFAGSALLLLITALFDNVGAHSFLTHPCPMSTIHGCRVGGTGGFIGNCPGPCPNYNLAADADPTNPAAVWKRGSYNRVVWTRNNHEGGFVRWTIVPIDKMWDKETHDQMAIDFGCWNVGRFKCNKFDFHRDCKYDRQNEAFSKMLYIPPIYPDGDYILGFTWFGGGQKYGHFGDYYDCSYIRIQGGDRIEPEHVPTFHAGGGSKWEDACESTVDDLGICWREPCVPIRKTYRMVPKKFKNGAKPPVVKSKWFEGKMHKHETTITIKRLRLIDTKTDMIIDKDLDDVIPLHRDDEISILAETTGDVQYVQWYTNGKQRGRDYQAPFTVAGDFRGDFYPWMHPLFNRRLRIAAKAVGWDGSYCWTNVEVRFSEVHSGGVDSFSTILLNDVPPGSKRSSSSQTNKGSGVSASRGGTSAGLGKTKRSAHDHNSQLDEGSEIVLPDLMSKLDSDDDDITRGTFE